MFHVKQVDADLVGASGEGATSQEGCVVVVVVFEDFKESL